MMVAESHQQCMALKLGEHQDIARAVSLLGEYNLADASVRLGIAMHLMQLEMCLYLLDCTEIARTPAMSSRKAP